MATKTSPARARRNNRQPLEALCAVKGTEPTAGLPTTALRPLEWAALEKAANKAGPFRDAIAPGLGQAVDLTLRISGTLDVGNDTQAKLTKKPDLERVLAVVLGTLTKPVRQRAVEAVLERFGGADPAARGEAELEISAELTGLVESLVEQTSREEKQHKRGNVTATLTTEVLARCG